MTRTLTSGKMSDDPKDDEDDNEEEAQDKLIVQAELAKEYKELQAIWAASASANIVKLTDAETKQGCSAMQKV